MAPSLVAAQPAPQRARMPTAPAYDLGRIVLRHSAIHTAATNPQSSTQAPTRRRPMSARRAVGHVSPSKGQRSAGTPARFYLIAAPPPSFLDGGQENRR